ncbi:MAG: insulinase family protein [Myxococcales bacterium]|nr:insulinase family protein [Myxococcales bacterium]MCB9519860.1 insulinase family protein [Myxococcales bacterium]MCB9532304.1 insulinase family protein [Myxococcales bacterium]
MTQLRETSAPNGPGRRRSADGRCAALRRVAVRVALSLTALAAGACGSSAANVVDDPGPVTRPAVPTIDRTRPPEPSEPRPFALPRIVDRTAPSGLRVVEVPRAGFPSVSLRLTFAAGAALAGSDRAVSEVLERVLRDGAAGMDAPELAARIDAAGLSLSVNVGEESTTLSADGLAASFDEALSIIAMLATAPTFPADRVAARRDERIGELALQRSRASFHATAAMRRAVFGADSPYGSSAASEEALAAVDRDAVADQWAHAYGPRVATLVIVGDLPDDVDARIDAAFGAWEGGPSERPATLSHAAPTPGVAHVVVRPNSAQTSLILVGPGIAESAPNYFDALVANQLLGGGPSSRLFMNLREEKSFTYGAYSRLDTFASTGIVRVYSDVRSDVTEPALAELIAEVGRTSLDVSDAATEARAYLAGVFPLELETNAAVAGRLASLAARGIAFDQLERYRGAVAATTDADVVAAAESLFQPGAMAAILVGDADVAIPAARAHFEHVVVYDLDGNVIEADTL